MWLHRHGPYITSCEFVTAGARLLQHLRRRSSCYRPTLSLLCQQDMGGCFARIPAVLDVADLAQHEHLAVVELHEAHEREGSSELPVTLSMPPLACTAGLRRGVQHMLLTSGSRFSWMARSCSTLTVSCSSLTVPCRESTRSDRTCFADLPECRHVEE